MSKSPTEDESAFIRPNSSIRDPLNTAEFTGQQANTEFYSGHSSPFYSKRSLRQHSEQEKIQREKQAQIEKRQKEAELRKERAQRREQLKQQKMAPGLGEEKKKFSNLFGEEIDETAEKSDDDEIICEENNDVNRELTGEERLAKIFAEALAKSQPKDIGKLREIEPFGDNTSTRNLEQFLREYEDMASAKKWTDIDKRKILKHYLKNPAREFYERILLSERKEWTKLKSYLRAFYLTPQQAFYARYELQKMTQCES